MTSVWKEDTTCCWGRQNSKHSWQEHICHLTLPPPPAFCTAVEINKYVRLNFYRVLELFFIACICWWYGQSDSLQDFKGKRGKMRQRCESLDALSQSVDISQERNFHQTIKFSWDKKLKKFLDQFNPLCICICICTFCGYVVFCATEHCCVTRSANALIGFTFFFTLLTFLTMI